MKPLEGVVVLDLSRILAAPFCTQMLTDLGATVWKIEAPWGDDTRRWGPPFAGTEADGESTYFLSLNRGKKGLALDLKDEKAQGLLRRLAEKSDVFVENYKTGDLKRFGLDHESLQEINPRLVYLSLTGYGQTGPRASDVGYDTVVQGLTGIMSVTGQTDGPPTKVGMAWIDVLTGLTGAIGVLAALRERDASGQGQRIDLSLFDVGLMSMVNLLQGYLITGEPPTRMGNLHPTVAPVGAYETRDGWMILLTGNDGQFKRLCETIGRTDLGDDPRLASNAGRQEHLEWLNAELTEAFREKTRGEWARLLGEAHVPAAPVNDLAEALADPHAEARGALWRVTHPTLGDLPLAANALQHMDRTPAESAGPPPLLGEHTREVLGEALGLSEAELDDLEEGGAILGRRPEA